MRDELRDGGNASLAWRLLFGLASGEPGTGEELNDVVGGPVGSDLVDDVDEVGVGLMPASSQLLVDRAIAAGGDVARWLTILPPGGSDSERHSPLKIATWSVARAARRRWWSRPASELECDQDHGRSARQRRRSRPQPNCSAIATRGRRRVGARPEPLRRTARRGAGDRGARLSSWSTRPADLDHGGGGGSAASWSRHGGGQGDGEQRGEDLELDDRGGGPAGRRRWVGGGELVAARRVRHDRRRGAPRRLATGGWLGCGDVVVTRHPERPPPTVSRAAMVAIIPALRRQTGRQKRLRSTRSYTTVVTR
jgi:hypothetical protein